MDKLADFKH